MSLGTLTATVDAETKGFVTGMASAAAKMESFAREVKKLGRDIAQAGLGILAFAGASLKMAAEVDSGVKASLDDLKDSVLTLAVQIARSIAPAVRELSDLLKGLADWFASLSPEVRANVAHWALFAVEAAAVAVAVSKVAGIVSGLAGLFSTLASAVAGVGLGTLVVTIATVIGALVAVVAVVIAVRKAWSENWGHIHERTAAIATGISDAFKGLFKFIVTGVQVVTKIFTDQVRSMVETAQSLLSAVGIHALDGLLETLKTGADWLDFLVTPEGVASLVDDAKQLGKNVADYFIEGTADARKWVANLTSFTAGAAERQHKPGAGPNMGEAYNANMKMGEKDEQGFTSPEMALAFEKELEARDDMAAELTDWNEAMADSAAAQKRIQDNLQDLASGAAAAGLHLTSKLGELGEVIGSVVQGAQSGGVWGALLALIIEMVSRMARWKEIMDVAQGQLNTLLSDLAGPLNNLIDAFKQLMGGIGVLARALHPIIGFVINIVARVFRHLTPIFVLVGKIIEPLGSFLEAIQSIIDIFDELMPIFKIMDAIFSIVGITILGSILAIGEFWNWILNSLEKFLRDTGVFAGLANEIHKVKRVDTEKMKQQIVDMAAGIMGGGLAAVADESAAAAEQIGKMGDAADEASEQLLNVPTGYKIAVSRFNASLAETSTLMMSDTIRGVEEYYQRKSFTEKGTPIGNGKGK